MGEQDYVIVGRVSGAFGTRGWLKIYSYTRPREGIFDYDRWFIRGPDGWEPRTVLQHKKHRASLIAQVSGFSDRDDALAAAGRDIAVAPEQLPATEAGEYYWRDLVGCDVVNTTGERLGTVLRLMETGANDVLVVGGEQEHLIPFVAGITIQAVDCERRVITVDWHAED